MTIAKHAGQTRGSNLAAMSIKKSNDMIKKNIYMCVCFYKIIIYAHITE